MLSVTHGNDTTERILDAAYEELLHFGVKGVSVEDIAKRVGVARITIYRRFKNKDELLAAVALHAVRTHPIVKRTLASEPELVTTFLDSQGGRLVAMAREFVSERAAVSREVAELIVRIGMSFVLMPDSAIKPRTASDTRAFARAYLVPMVNR